MTDFLPVLALGVILLAAMFLFFGGLQIGPAPAHKGGGFEEELPESPTVSGTIGYPQETTRTVSIGKDFSVSFESGEKSEASLRNSSVENGVFGRVDREISFDTANQEDMQSARIKMNITDTNLYGYLVATLNANVIFQNYSLAGKLEIPFNKSLLKPSGNSLRVEATGSSWRMWAPAVYRFDADVLVSYYSLKTKSFSFTEGKDGKNPTKTRLVLVVSGNSGSGNLIARVNGLEVYRGNGTRLAIADFPVSNVYVDRTNNIEFLAEKGAKYDISSAEIILYYQPAFMTQTLYYNLTSSEYSGIENVTLSFGIDRIVGDVVSILIRVTDGAGGVHSIIPQGILREGNAYSVNLSRKELYTGSNKIEFVAAGNGSVSIVNATIIR